MENYEKTYNTLYSKEERSSIDWKNYIYENAPFATNYRYLFGTILTFYALEYCDVSDMIKLNHTISNYQENPYEENCCGELENILSSIGIDITHTKTLNDSIESMKKFIGTIENNKRRIV